MASLDAIMDKRLPDGVHPKERRLRLTLTEIALFEQFSNEPTPYWAKASECIVVATEEYWTWLEAFENGTANHPIDRAPTCME